MQVKYTFTKSDFEEFFNYMTDKTPYGMFLRNRIALQLSIVYLSLILYIAIISLIIATGEISSGVFLIVIAVYVGLIILFSKTKLMHSRSKRRLFKVLFKQYSKFDLGFLDSTIVHTFTDDKIIEEIDSYYSSSLEYNKAYHIGMGKSVFYIFINQERAFCVTRRSFKTDEEFNDCYKSCLKKAYQQE
jgi:hypothetical protein